MAKLRSDEVLLLRADGDGHIGTGHIMRCLALTQAWQETGGAAHFAPAGATPALEARLTSEGINITRLNASPGSAEDATQTVALARQIGATWVVVDGYHFGADYQQMIKATELRLLFIDDYGHADHYCADIVLNQNLYANESLYAGRAPGVELLLGTRYVLLRREFWPWRGWKREISPVARKILVTMGGADPNNVTLKVIQALQQADIANLEAIVVVGGGNPHLPKLESATRNTQHAIRLIHNASNMPDLMAWADVAISAGGSTCWELAFMGLPHLAPALADNQTPVAAGLDAAGAALDLGRADTVTPTEIAVALTQLMKSAEQRAAMSGQGQRLVDGEGAPRVIRTGKVDRLLYAYDQPQRLRAIEKTPARAGVAINDTTKILDFGCGTGDLIKALLKHGQPKITAIDISDETIHYVQQRFAAYPNVTAGTIAVQDIEFPPASFALVIGINILQHIIDDSAFNRAIEAILRVIKMPGPVLFSPTRQTR